MASLALRLEELAERQRTGTPFTAEQLEFINQAVVIQHGCGEPEGSSGWYAGLCFNNFDSVAFDPTIADVHTQPSDEATTWWAACCTWAPVCRG